MNEDVVIRKCAISDLDRIKPIFREFVAYHAGLESSFIKVENHEEFFAEFISGHLDSETNMVLVAIYRGELIGYCIGMIQEKPPVYPDPRYGYVDNLCVLEKHQRCGAGRLLFEEMMRWFASKGIHRIEIFAAIGNKKSTSFWGKMGFTPYLEEMYLKI